MTTSLLLVVGLLLAAVIAIAGLFRPFLGMLVFVVIHFSQPGELIPALEPFRIEFVYGTLLTGVLLLRGMSRSGQPSLLSDRILLGSFFLIGAGVLSVPFAVWPGGAAGSVVEMVKLVALTFLLKLLIDSEERMRMVLWCMVGVAAWFSVSSLSAFFGGEFYALKYDWGTLDRAEGLNSIVGGPNELAGVLLALLPLLVVLLRITRNVFARILLVACGAVSLAAISLTGSRIAMVGLVVIACVYIFQSKHKLLTCAACAVLGVLIWVGLPPEYHQRYLTVESYAQGGDLDASNELRLEIWKAGWQLFSKYPILGVGAGQFSNAYGMIYLNGKSGQWMSPHNLLIQTGCELGIIGLAAFFYFFWQLIKSILFVLHKPKEDLFGLNYEMAIACLVMCLGVIIISTVGHTLYRPYWYLLAGLVAANRSIALLGADKQAPTSTKVVAPPTLVWQALKPSLANRRNPFLRSYRPVQGR
jgi:O-antigen ligase